MRRGSCCLAMPALEVPAGRSFAASGARLTVARGSSWRYG